jgi:hypothetical protein
MPVFPSALHRWLKNQLRVFRQEAYLKKLLLRPERSSEIFTADIDIVEGGANYNRILG